MLGVQEALLREDFNRNLADFKHWFGDHNKEFWLGNDQIHQLTKAGDIKLRVEIGCHDGWSGQSMTSLGEIYLVNY